MTVERFASLFSGRSDAYWTEGRMAVRQPVTLDTYRRHLTDGPAIGTYPLVDGQVAWGCSDIDLPRMGISPDDPTMALNLWRTLKALGITSWVERSKSKGWHVFVFTDGWCPAEWMRNALLVAHQVAGVPPTEVNPKNVSPGVDLGNTLRIPYPGGLCGFSSAGRQIVVAPDEDPLRGIPLAEFVSAAYASRNAPEVIERAAALWRPPEKIKIVRPTSPIVIGGQLTDRLSPLAWTVFREGPTDRFGHDRSRSLQRLAFLCSESGLSPSETLELLCDAEGRWGGHKYTSRPDGEKYLRKMVENAY